MSSSGNYTEKQLGYPLWFGGSASCCAACITHPLDLVKVRLQTRNPEAPKSMIGTCRQIIKNDQLLGLYRGLSASLIRQITYSTTRFAVYEHLKSISASKKPKMPTLIAMASLSGLLGGIAGNSADVLNVRMQHDAALPIEQRRNYKNPIHGFIRMTKEEGWKSHFRGVVPNSLRAALVTAAQLASYDGFKRLIVSYTPLKHDLSIQLSASCLAGFVATTVCNPVDVIKSRIMSSSQRQNLRTLLADLYRLEGIRWVFRGWLPSFVRLGPHTVATLLFLEQHKMIYRKIIGADESVLT